MIRSTFQFADIEELQGVPVKVFFERKANLPSLLAVGVLMDAQVPDHVHAPQGDEEVLVFQPEAIGDWHEYVVTDRRVRLVREDDTVSPSKMQLVATYTLDVVTRKGT